MTDQTIPLIRLSFFEPFVKELQLKDVDVSAIFRTVGLDFTNFEDESAFIPAATMYQLAEKAASKLKNPFLGAVMGQQFARDMPVFFRQTSKKTETLGDMLIGFVTATRDHASSQYYSLHIDGNDVELFGSRTFSPRSKVDQVDGWDAAVWVTYLKSALRRKFISTKVRIQVANPQVIPKSVIPVHSLVKGDKRGCRIKFPSKWLNETHSSDIYSDNRPAQTVKGAIIQTLDTMDLSAVPNLENLARQLDRHPRKLQRQLQVTGTTFTELVDDSKRRRAIKLVKQKKLSINDIANQLGYENLANFSRCFKRWTGVSPRKFRNK